MTDDHYHPPLDGLLSGNKYNVILNAIKGHDDVNRVDYQKGDSENDPRIYAELDTEEAILDQEEADTLQILDVSWWHVKGKKDWFQFHYLEFSVDFDQMVEDHESPDEIDEEAIDDYIETIFSADWNRQENELVDGDDYLRILTVEGEEDIVEEDEYLKDTPEAVTREIIDDRIPGLIDQLSD